MSDICASIMGDFGPWQARTVAIVFLLKLPLCWFTVSLLFTAPTPYMGDIYCLLAPNKSIDNLVEHRETRSKNWVKVQNPALGLGDNEVKMYFCSIAEESWKHLRLDQVRYRFDNVTNAWTEGLEEEPECLVTPKPELDLEKLECLQYDYVDERDKHKALNSQFDLVCSRDLLVTLTQTFHNIGQTVGTIAAFFAIKRISPKFMMYSALLPTIVLGLITGMVRIYEFHLIFRAALAASAIVMVHGGGWIFQDICHGRMRKIVSMTYDLSSSVGLIIFPGIAKNFDDWMHLYVCMTLPVLLLCLFYWIVPDSPRWLVRHDRIDEAILILARAAATNNREQYMTSNLASELNALKGKLIATSSPASYSSLYKVNGLKVTMWFILNLCWATWGACYIGVLLNIRNFGYQYVYYNTVAMGVSEVMGLFLAYYMIMHSAKRFKWLFTGIFGIFSGLLAISSWFLPIDMTAEEQSMYFMALSMPLKMVVSCGISVATMCSAELFTEEQRYIAGYALLIMLRFNPIYAVYIGAAMKHGLPIVMSIWGAISVAGGISCLLVALHPAYREM